jgi:hypothetical protein
MRLLVFQHIACEHPGISTKFLEEDDIGWEAVKLDEGDKIPTSTAITLCGLWAGRWMCGMSMCIHGGRLRSMAGLRRPGAHSEDGG